MVNALKTLDYKLGFYANYVVCNPRNSSNAISLFLSFILTTWYVIRAKTNINSNTIYGFMLTTWYVIN